jgi:hypothetical protein
MLPYRHCIYDAEKPIALPNNIQLTESISIGSLRIDWDNPSCSDSSYISHYIFKFCKEQSCKDDDFQAAVIVNVTKAMHQWFMLDGLAPNTNYCIYIQSGSPFGHTNFSVHYYTTIPRSLVWSRTLTSVTVICSIVFIFVAAGAIVTAQFMHRKCRTCHQGPTIILPEANNVVCKPATPAYSHDGQSLMGHLNRHGNVTKPLLNKKSLLVHKKHCQKKSSHKMWREERNQLYI